MFICARQITMQVSTQIVHIFTEKSASVKLYQANKTLLILVHFPRDIITIKESTLLVFI